MWYFLHHLFLPHHSNNHKARVLHHDGLLAVIGVFTLFALFLRFGRYQAPDVLGYATDINVVRLLEDTNKKRQEQGLSPLVLNTQLSQAAAKKAADMFAHNYWAHVSPSGATPWDFITQSGYTYQLAGENLAKNFQNSEGVVAAWMDSPSHRENLLKPGYKDMGFAIVNGVLNGEETTLVVQMFGSTNVKPVVAQVPTANRVVVPVQAADVQGEQTAELNPLPPIAVAKQPLIDITSTTKVGAVGLLIAMAIVMIADMLIVKKRGIVRASGRMYAHVGLVLLFIALLGFAIRGSIL